MTGTYRLRVPDALAQRIRKLHPSLKKKVRAALAVIVEDPSRGKPLQLELMGLWTYRVSRFRIIYRPGPDRIIDLVALGPRRTIYEETYRLILSEPEKNEAQHGTDSKPHHGA